MNQRTDHAELRRQMATATPERAESIRNRIAEANLGLVRAYARRLGPPFGFHGPDIDDVTAEFSIVLIDVINRWDPDNGQPLQVALWIAARERVRQMRDNETGWGSASGGRRRWAKATSAARRVEGQLGRPATDHEISAECGIDPAEIANLRARFEHSGDGIMSLDVTGDIAPSDDGTAVAAAGESAHFIAQMADMVTSRNADVGKAFRVRFGLDGPPPPENQPWQDVADACGCSIRTAQRLVTEARGWVAEWLTGKTGATP